VGSRRTPKAVRVFGPDGRETPAQLANGKVVFAAKVPSVGFAVYDVRPAASPMASSLKVGPASLENSRYRVALDANGDVASIFDKALGRELLAAPARLEIKTDKPAQWPAWNMDWADQSRAPRAYVGGPAKIAVVENGPARVAVEVRREAKARSHPDSPPGGGGAVNKVGFATVIMEDPAATPGRLPPHGENAAATTTTSARSNGRPTPRSNSRCRRTSGST
jgi:alpha-mannosidase